MDCTYYGYKYILPKILFESVSILAKLKNIIIIWLTKKSMGSSGVFFIISNIPFINKGFTHLIRKSIIFVFCNEKCSSFLIVESFNN